MVVIEGDYLLGEFLGRRYDIDPTGEQFLLLKAAGESGTEGPSFSSLTFVVNWLEELKRLVPVD